MDNQIKSFQHQTDVYEKSKDEKSYAFFLETGTGKTKIAIDTLIHLYQNQRIEAALIIAPKAVYKKVWVEQLRKFIPPEINYAVLHWHTVRTFAIDEQLRAFVNRVFKSKRLSIFLVNVEAFAYKPIEPYVRAFLTNYRSATIIDESTRIKNPQAARTKKILQIAPFSHYRRILSGFPVLNSPTDLYSQLCFLDKSLLPFASYFAWRNFYCVLKQIDRRVTIEIGYKNLDHLSELIKPFSSRILKKDCLDLPPKIYEQRFVEMSANQAVAYKSMKEKAFVALNKEVNITAVNLMTQLNKLHQIANGILLGPVGNMTIETEKDRVLIDILQDETNGPIAIAANYTNNIKHLLALIQGRFGVTSCRTIYGEISDNERNISINLFQSGKLRYLLINPSTVREGIDLFTSHTCIFYNNSFKLDHRIQFEDRFHRIGQTNKVTYIDLITENSVEERLLEKLQNKRNIGGSIFAEEEWKEWFN